METIKDVSNLEEYLKNLKRVGFQSTSLGEARGILRKIKEEKPTVFFAFTANMVASGIRGYVAKLVGSGLVNAIITTAGSLEHDLIKSFKDYLLGDFEIKDEELREKGMNRVGNILIDNSCYEFLEKINFKIFERYVKKGEISPSQLAREYGEVIAREGKNKRNSFLYQAYKREIPVFSPGILDGAIGLNLYFFRNMRKENKEFSINPSLDINKLSKIVLEAEKTAGIILGGGISKHHTIGINIVRGGLDYAIYVTTSQEFDGSLSGAKPKEGVSWGKIKDEKNSTVVYGEASLVLPLLMEGII